jgi:CHAT domain-containing protein
VAPASLPALVCLSAWLAQQVAPIPGRSTPGSIAIGGAETITPVAGDEGVALTLDVAVVEPLTFLAESFDCDVRLSVETPTGEVLAEDEDGGIETDAQLSWTPSAAGRVVVRVLAEDAAASATIQVLRGALSATPPDEELAARAYWERAWDRARGRRDEFREKEALAKLGEIEKTQDLDGLRAALLKVVEANEDANRRLDQAERAASNFAFARERIRDAIARLLEADARSRALSCDSLSRAAGAARARGDLEASARAYRARREFLEATLPEAHPELQRALANDALATSARGDLPGARALQERVRSIREQTLPEEHLEVQHARLYLAITMHAQGELSAARALLEKVLAVLEGTLPDDADEVQIARMSLANTRFRQGDLAGAHVLREKVLAIAEQRFPDTHPDLQIARENLAITLSAEGDVAAARALFEKVLTVRERTLPEENPDLLRSRLDLADWLYDQGEFADAQAIQEKVLSIFERKYPEAHPFVQMARQYLASSMKSQDDFAGARALEEKVLEMRERTLTEDNPDVLDARTNLANTMVQQGQQRDVAGARVLLENVLSLRERTLAEEHPLLQIARENLAHALAQQGEHASALALEEKVLAIRERTLPEASPDLQRTREVIADLLLAQGESARGRAQLEKVLEVYERTLPAEDPDLRRAREMLLGEQVALGAAEPALQTMHRLIASSLARLRGSAGRSPREREELVARAGSDLSLLLSMAPWVAQPSSLDVPLLELIDRGRSFGEGVDVARVDAATQGRLDELRAAVQAQRVRVADLVAGLGAMPQSDEESARVLAEHERVRLELPAAIVERDRSERDFERELRALRIDPPEVTVDALARALPKESAAIEFVAYGRLRPEAGDPRKPWRSRRALVAFVVTPDARVQRVELGDLEAIETLARRWRAAIERSAGRAVAAGASGSDVLGAELRAAVVDPVIAAAGGARSLHLCLDGVLHLVPLEALPIEGGAVVGDRIRLHLETSFSRLVRRSESRAPNAAPAAALLLGAIDFDAAGEAPASTSATPPASPPIESDRAPSARGFPSLRETRYEVDAISDYFEKAFGTAAVALKDEKATKSAFLAAAPSARFLHVATHGYFSTANVRWMGGSGESSSRAAESAPLWRPQSLEERVASLSPLTLCGLALVGANRGRDSRGRVPGILTAEELCGVDLSRCELAVLSACDTNVGVERAGLGIASLQKALHRAGARSAITSLWKVDDERTRELMADFYRRLWVEKKPIARALWEAKCSQRARGAPIRDWAAWVLTGDPGADATSAGANH